MQNVFVYGTLKRGQPRQRAMSGQIFIRAAATDPIYRMFDLGSYPGLVHSSEQGDRVRGEVFQIDASCRQVLDLIEGVESGLYEFKQIQLQHCRDLEPVYAYFYLGDVEGCKSLTNWPPLDDGDDNDDGDDDGDNVSQ